MRIWMFIASLLLPLFFGTAADMTPPRENERTDALSQPASESQTWV